MSIESRVQGTTVPCVVILMPAKRSMGPSGAWSPGSHWGYKRTVSPATPVMVSCTLTMRRSTSDASTDKESSPENARSLGFSIGAGGALGVGPGLARAKVAPRVSELIKAIQHRRIIGQHPCRFGETSFILTKCLMIGDSGYDKEIRDEQTRVERRRCWCSDRVPRSSADCRVAQDGDRLMKIIH